MNNENLQENQKKRVKIILCGLDLFSLFRYQLSKSLAFMVLIK